jgi:hypothetical protein
MIDILIAILRWVWKEAAEKMILDFKLGNDDDNNHNKNHVY